MFNVVQVGWRIGCTSYLKEKKENIFTNLLMNRNLSFFINKIIYEYLFLSLSLYVCG